MNVNGIANQGPLEGLDPEGGSSNATSVTGNVDPCGTLLPAPSVVAAGNGDIGAEIAMLSLRAGQDEDFINTAAENTENNIQDAAEANEVSEMHTEASDIMNNAYAAGAMQMVQGAMQITGGSVGTDAQPAFTGAATLAGAGATIWSAQGQAVTLSDQAIVTADKADADRAGQLSGEASQGQNDARSIISNALAFYREYQTTAGQTDLVAAGQRA